MKLYSKTLTSLDELEREKIRLRYERKGTKSKHLLPDLKKVKKKITGGGKKSEDSTGGLLNLALGLMKGGSPLQTAISLAGPVMGLISKGSKGAPRRFLGKVVKDVVIAYAIGKGVQLAFKGMKAYSKAQKAKQAAARANPSI